jgi:hypothetical protein
MPRPSALSSAPAAATAFVSLGAIGPAAAAPPERIHDQSDEIVEDFCGDLTVREVVDVTVTSSTKTRGGPDGLVYFADHFRGSVSYTNVENGLTFTNTFNTLSKDLKVTDNGDGTLTILTLATGNSTVYGPDGQVLRDPGQIRFEVVIDHAGTPTDPSDDIFISETMVKGSTGRNDLEGHDFCDDLHDFIG